jgi:hypothetical protein
MSQTLTPKLAYRAKEAADFIGSDELLKRMVAAGWIEPKIREHKLTIYDGAELAACWQRICRGDRPPVRSRKTPRGTEGSHV